MLTLSYGSAEQKLKLAVGSKILVVLGRLDDQVEDWPLDHTC